MRPSGPGLSPGPLAIARRHGRGYLLLPGELLLPGAWAGLPAGNWPGGKWLCPAGAIRSSSFSMRNLAFFSSLRVSIAILLGGKEKGSPRRSGHIGLDRPATPRRLVIARGVG